MVGRWTTKGDLPQPPLPPYEQVSDPKVVLSETTTTRTEVVTTTTTTQFFSLPLWRKRSTPTDVEVGEHGQVHLRARSDMLMVEKDLPPTPIHASADDLTASNGAGRIQSKGSEVRNTITPITFPTQLPEVEEFLPPIPSTAALALASLGAGLPHVLSHASASAIPSEVPKSQLEVSMPEAGPSTRTVRKSKSAHKLRTSPEQSISPSISFEGNIPKRTRGFSHGASALFGLATTDSTKKAKGEDPKPAAPSDTVPKLLSRRPSFWLKKKSKPPPQTPFELVNSPLTPLPTPPPLSPFKLDTKITPSVSPAPLRAQSVSRRHTRAHSSRRPATADSSAPSIKQLLTHKSSPPSFQPLATTSHERMQASKSAEAIFPPLRPRARTNPSLMRRLSLNRLSIPSSPLPYLSANTSSCPHSLNKSSACLRPHLNDLNNISPESAFFVDSPLSNESRINVDDKEEGLPSDLQESPEAYVEGLQSTVNRAEIAGLLAASSDPFHVEALRTYVGQFDFVADPLDVALRKLLMEIGLPRETQQIDRVMEAFAWRYSQCNPTLFTTEDNPYILAFSLIMLHTDAFNKSNKRKMTKADYIKNTRLPGVAPEVLDCFYDNIVFAPFIFMDDPLDVNGQRRLTAQSSVWPSTSSPMEYPLQSPSAYNRASKLDPYHLIINRLLGPLRVDTEAYVPSENPYAYEGPGGSYDETRLRHAFAKASEVGPGNMDPGGSLYPSRGGPIYAPESVIRSSSLADNLGALKVTKIGLLNRKDDVLEGGKRASNRKWKQWTVILTGSQLLFFRDPSSFLGAQSVPADGQVTLPQVTMGRPDELMSVKDAVAVFDRSYLKHRHTFRFVLADGLQLLLQAPNDEELNAWISIINYASAFKSAGVRMRPLEMSRIDVKLTGVAAATSHLNDLQHQNRPIFGPGATLHRGPTESHPRSIEMERDPPTAPEIDGAEELEATFDEIKADLAAGRWALSDDRDQAFAIPATSARYQNKSFPSRAQIIQLKVEDLNSRLATSQLQLDSCMRFVRNIATLTPFQRSTRERLTTAVQGISQRVAQVRLEITKLTCHRHILLSDLSSEANSWQRNKAIALQAATETLQTFSLLPRLGHPASQNPSPAEGYFLHPVARSCSRPESSICESFHSALEFGSERPSAETSTSVSESGVDIPSPTSPQLFFRTI